MFALFTVALCLILAFAQCAVPISHGDDHMEIWNMFTKTSVPVTIRRQHAALAVDRRTPNDEPPHRPNDYVIGYNVEGNVLARSEIVRTDQNTFDLRVFTESTIRFIEARDRSANGTGGYVRRVSGGIDDVYLHMVFASAGGQPIEFTVDVWTTNANDVGTPAAHFQLGNITAKSVIMFGEEIQADVHHRNDELLELTFVVHSMPDYYFTRIEAFDLSDTQTTGGNVLVTRGGIGSTITTVRVTAAAPGQDVYIYLVMYAENLLTGGNNFWLGTFGPHLSVLSVQLLTAQAEYEARSHRQHSWGQERFEIRFVQGWDHVERGTGRLESVGGGIGENSITLNVASGIGEPLALDVAIWGVYRP